MLAVLQCVSDLVCLTVYQPLLKNEFLIAGQGLDVIRLRYGREWYSRCIVTGNHVRLCYCSEQCAIRSVLEMVKWQYKKLFNRHALSWAGMNVGNRVYTCTSVFCMCSTVSESSCYPFPPSMDTSALYMCLFVTGWGLHGVFNQCNVFLLVEKL